MRLIKRLSVTVVPFAFAILPVLADGAPSGKPAVSGKDNAAQRIEEATARHVEILTGLLSRVPEQAQPGIEKAMASAQEGRDRALAALAGQDGSGESESTKPEVTGLERARTSVAAGFDKSTATLEHLLEEAPAQAASRIEAALDRLDKARAVALRNLDRLIAGERPDHPASPDRPDRPEVPSRPDRPELPERAQAPDRPERPQVPDRPSPPQG